MSGLFATLIAAATGEAPAVEARPLARFEGAVPQFDSELAVDGEVPRTPRPELESGKTRRNAEAPAAPRSRDRSVIRDAVAPPERAGARLDLAPRGAPKQEPPMSRRRSPPNSDGKSPPSLLPSRTAPAVGQPRGKDRADQAKPVDTRRRALAVEAVPRLLSAREPAARPAPARVGPAETPRAEHRGLNLTIGRIEVRQTAPVIHPSVPSTAPAPNAPPTVTTRAVTLPRAAVRQSLDDYRASRRR